MAIYVWQGQSADASVSWFNSVYLHFYLLVCNVVKACILEERAEINGKV